MAFSKRKLSLASISLLLILGACVLPATYAPTLPPQNMAYTAAAETIAAQLTAIANPALQITSDGSPMVGLPTLAKPISTETLPSTSTPLPTNTPISSDTPFPSPTLAQTQPISQTGSNLITTLGEPTWKDSFQDSVNWPMYNDTHIQMEIVDQRLSMTALIPDQQNPYDGWMVSQTSISDFYLVVSASPGECSGLDRYGLLARASLDANRCYLFGFSCDGQFSLRIWNGHSFKTLVDWTNSPLIFSGAGETNQLGLKAEGTKLSLFANGDLLTELENDAFSEGAFGLFIGAVNTAGFTVEFDDMAYWEIP